MFTYNDTVLVRTDGPVSKRAGQKAWVIGMTTQDQRDGTNFGQFPTGTVYLVEFEDGEALDIHEGQLEALET